MQIVKRMISLTCLFVLIVSASGCSLDFSSVENLMRAPKLTGEYAAVERAFEATVGSSVSLLSPRAGDYRTAFVMYDYDADGDDEALVFYTTNTDNATVHIHFLDCVNGEWISCDDEIGKEKDIYELLFKDLNNDGIPEIIVNFNTKLSNRSMLIYCLTPATDNTMMQAQLLSNVQYTSYVILDMDQDGISEILYTVLEVSVDSGVTLPFVRVLKFLNDAQGYRIDMVSSLPLYSGITSFAALAADSTGDTVRVYVDCYYLDTMTMITEVVTWSPENGYMLLLHMQESTALLKTTRMNGLLTEDLNDDGIMDIPGEYELPISEFVNVAEGMLPVAIGRNYYNCQQDGSVTLVKADYMDPSKRYSLDLLQLGLYGSVCVVFDYITEDTSFYEYDAVNSLRGKHLFTISIKDVNGEAGAYFDISDEGYQNGLTPALVLDSLHMIETDVN